MRTTILLLASVMALAAEPLRFRITLGPKVAPHGASGRLFVLMEKGDAPRERIRVDFVPENVWMAAKEVPGWKPGEVVELNADEMAFPRAFSKAAKGDYVVMALLDPDHSFARDRQDAGDLTSAVKVIRGFDPAAGEPVALEITERTPERAPVVETPNVKKVEFTSAVLSAFWGRPIVMRAGVVLPPGEHKGLPAIYRIHGFGGNYREAWQASEQLGQMLKSGERFPAAYVFLDANCPGGHHAFADSVNNGPWGQALTEELIPHIEQRFGLAGTPEGRFLTGHSSGGWTALWLQVRYPDFFGGSWPTSPDAMDFRNFTGIDATPDSMQRAYTARGGGVLNLVRMDGKDVLSFEEFARMERVTGDYGGQLASFEWVFSPRGADGRPLPLFNRDTGELSREARLRWQEYDIGRIVRDNWETLGPKLRGKLRLAIGAEDNFHLNESAELFCGWLKEKGREDVCEIVPGRDHFTLFRPYKTYPEGLQQRINSEMRAKWEKAGQPR